MDLLAYVRVYGIILLPGAVFVTALSLLMNVILRNKYLVYAISIGTVVGVLYLYNLGYNHWLYNPTMYGLWSYADLMQGAGWWAMIWHRAYWLVLAITSLLLAHPIFERKSN